MSDPRCQSNRGPQAGELARRTGSNGELKATEPAIAAGLSWLVDGYNVLHACLLGGTERSRWWTEESRERLLARAARFEDLEAEIWVVFDGRNESQELYSPAPGPEPTQGRAARGDWGRPPVHLVFAPSADEWIRKRVRRAERPERIAVVTGDRQLTGRSAQYGARVLSPQLFLSLCDDPETTPSTP